MKPWTQLLPLAFVALFTTGCNTTLWDCFSEDYCHADVECVTVHNLNLTPITVWFENRPRVIDFDKKSTFGRNVADAPLFVIVALGGVTNKIALPNEGGGSHHYVEFLDFENHCCP